MENPAFVAIFARAQRQALSPPSPFLPDYNNIEREILGIRMEINSLDTRNFQRPTRKP